MRVGDHRGVVPAGGGGPGGSVLRHGHGLRLRLAERGWV